MICLAIIWLLNLLIKGYHMDDRMSLMELNSSLSEAEKYLDNQDMNKDSAIFFGNARSGKSILINYLMDNKLEVDRYSKLKSNVMIKAFNESIGPEIGIGSLSTTAAPKGWTSKIFPNLTLWDVPGFDDNRGPVQECTNSFYLYRLVKSVKSLKIILVVDIQDIIQDNTQQFLSLLKAIEDLFGNQFKDSFSSISVIFTKVPETSNGQLINKEYIKYHLETHVLLDNGLELVKVLKNFTMFLLKNDDRFALFKRISFLNNVTADIDADIISVLNNSERIQSNLLQDVHPMISTSSMLQLLQAKEIAELEQMAPMLKRNVKQVLFNEAKKIEIFLNNSNKIELNNTKLELIEIKNRILNPLTHESNLNQNVEKIFSIHPQIWSTFDKQKWKINLQLIQSVESVLHISISKSLKMMIDYIIHEFIRHLQSIVYNIDVVLENTPSKVNSHNNTYVEKFKDFWNRKVNKVTNFFSNMLSEVFSSSSNKSEKH